MAVITLYEDEKVTSKVNDAILFLKPYFLADKQDIRLPKVYLASNLDKPYYDTSMCIRIPSNYEMLDAIISHESGHFIHHCINPEIWEILQIPARNIIETVGIYAEATYLTNGEFINSERKFRLPFLATMRWKDVKIADTERIYKEAREEVKAVIAKAKT